MRRTDSPQYFQLKRSGTLVGNSIISTNSNAKQPVSNVKPEFVQYIFMGHNTLFISLCFSYVMVVAMDNTRDYVWGSRWYYVSVKRFGWWTDLPWNKLQTMIFVVGFWKFWGGGRPRWTLSVHIVTFGIRLLYWQYPEELQRSASVSTTHSGRSMTRDIQPYSKKSKPLFKALFSMLKQKRDGKPCR